MNIKDLVPGVLITLSGAFLIDYNLNAIGLVLAGPILGKDLVNRSPGTDADDLTWLIMVDQRVWWEREGYLVSSRVKKVNND